MMNAKNPWGCAKPLVHSAHNSADLLLVSTTHAEDFNDKLVDVLQRDPLACPLGLLYAQGVMPQDPARLTQRS